MKEKTFINDNSILDIVLKYGVVFFIGLILLIMSLILIKKDYYYQNNIDFLENNKAIIIVDKKYLEIIKNKPLIINDITCKYNIDTIEELNIMYVVEISLHNNLKVYTNTYKVLIGKESLLQYIIRIIGGTK